VADLLYGLILEAPELQPLPPEGTVRTQIRAAVADLQFLQDFLASLEEEAEGSCFTDYEEHSAVCCGPARCPEAGGGEAQLSAGRAAREAPPSPRMAPPDVCGPSPIGPLPTPWSPALVSGLVMGCFGTYPGTPTTPAKTRPAPVHPRSPALADREAYAPAAFCTARRRRNFAACDLSWKSSWLPGVISPDLVLGSPRCQTNDLRSSCMTEADQPEPWRPLDREEPDCENKWVAYHIT
jgi:hypothetical protein